MQPDLLVVGHIVRDIVPGGWRAGGSVAYASAQAAALGLRVAAVTACGPELDPRTLVPGVEWQVRSDATSTVFENTYDSAGRRQRLLGQAGLLRFDDIPLEWRSAPAALLGPVFHDIDPALPAQLAADGRLVCICPQGWLRRREGDRILPGHVVEAPEWCRGDVLVVSEEDIDQQEAVATWQAHVPVVVLTRGDKGCSVWTADGRRDYPSLAGTEIDSTGAGDVFAAALTVSLLARRTLEEAVYFASAAAALSIRAEGLDAIADAAAIGALLESQAGAGVSR
jgi:1D-myo-inositol 3-kinase